MKLCPSIALEISRNLPFYIYCRFDLQCCKFIVVVTEKPFLGSVIKVCSVL